MFVLLFCCILLSAGKLVDVNGMWCRRCVVFPGAGEDKNVHISNVPKSTTQELLFVVFPTAYSIQMPRDGKDKG